MDCLLVYLLERLLRGSVGLTTGLSLGLANGGAACIQYVVLRLFLWRGGYIFAHRLLLEYFVSLDASASSAELDSAAHKYEVQAMDGSGK